VCVNQPEGQVEGDVHGPQGSCGGVQQTHLLGVQLPALTGHAVHPHQAVAGVQQPGGAHAQNNHVSHPLESALVLSVCVRVYGTTCGNTHELLSL